LPTRGDRSERDSSREANSAVITAVNNIEASFNKAKSNVKQLEQEAAACWDGASHLIHTFEIEEVRLTETLLQLGDLASAGHGAELDARLRQLQSDVKGLGGQLLRAKQQCL
jgi:hypothetical protein